jgi:hypothetical protein
MDLRGGSARPGTAKASHVPLTDICCKPFCGKQFGEIAELR